MFELSKQNMYHMPHNTARSKEVLFLIQNLDSRKKTYNLRELMKLLLISEVKENLFEEYHPKSHKQLTDPISPPDYNKIKEELKKIYNSKKIKNGMHKTLYFDLMREGVEKTSKKFIKERSESFSKFISNPNKFYDELLNTPYSITKNWKQIWIEYVRDIVDFCAYVGILPAFYKVALSSSSDDLDGYYLTEFVEEIKKNKEKFYEKILNFEYSNSSINIQRFEQFNIKVRPFFIGLKILEELSKLKINKIERRLFFATISNFQNENELDDAIRFLKNFIKEKGNELTPKNSSESLSKEGGRIATGMQDFYLESGLVEIKKEGVCLYFLITEKGKSLLKNIEPNTLFFGQHDEKTGLIYTPLVASLLRKFSINTKKENFKISLKEIYQKYKEIDEDILDETIKLISQLSPSPIKKITNKEIDLAEFKNQYSVNPYLDFIGLNEIDFILDKKEEIIIKRVEELKVKLPPQEIMNNLREASLSGDGVRYEKNITIAMNLLPGELIPFGNTSSVAQRISDHLWIVEAIFNNEPQKIAVVIEAKSGKAIKSFDERKEIIDIKNTLVSQRNKLKDLKGIWVLVLDSDSIPVERGHGGLRRTAFQKSFMEKLLFIHTSLLQEFAIPTLVTAFGIDAFIEYYKYLYSLTQEYNLKILNSYVQNFFMNGNLFFNEYRYVNILREEKDVKNKLFV